jgi:hypothetical protein
MMGVSFVIQPPIEMLSVVDAIHGKIEHEEKEEKS